MPKALVEFFGDDGDAALAVAFDIERHQRIVQRHAQQEPAVARARAEGNAKALKSSFYTGMAYLVTVALMVLPYLLLPNSLYLAAFAILLAVVVMIIAVFNYYVSVVQSIPFWPRFAEMGTISLSVAAISFVIGLLAKHLLGIEI